MRKLLSAVLVAGVGLPAAAQHSAHEHGVAELRVAVDGKRLEIELESPLDNLVGFEHAPRDARQRAALSEARKRLEAADKLFVLPATAACTLKSASVEMPFGEGHDHDAEHEHAEAGAHSDALAHYAWECAKPAELKVLGVNIFDSFPQLHRLRAETAGPDGQGSAELDKARRKLAL